MNEIAFTTDNYIRHPAQLTAINEATLFNKNYITGIRLKTDVPLKAGEPLIVNLYDLTKDASYENFNPYIFSEVVTEYERTSGTNLPDTYEYVINFDDKYINNHDYQGFFAILADKLDISEEIGFDRW